MKPMRARGFVKSADTSTSALNSKSQLDKLLRRYGASALAMYEDIAARQIIVTFVVPDSVAEDAARVAVKLPISVYTIYDALYGRPRGYRKLGDGTFGYTTTPSDYTTKRLGQAERVAWRNLVLWVDAALSAATAGLQPITEAFCAHAVTGASGERMIEVVEAAKESLGIGVQRLLTCGVTRD